MKALTFLLFFSFALQSFAQNTLLDSHRAICESLDTDTCRLVIIPQKTQEKIGVCQGTLMGSIPCVVSYGVEVAGSAMNLTCGTDFSNPEINQDISSTAIDYKVAAIINSQTYKVESARFTNISSPLMSLNITEVDEVRTHIIMVKLEGGVFPLEDISCQ